MVTFAYEMLVGERKVANRILPAYISGEKDFRPTRLPEKYLRLFGIERGG